MSLEEEYTDNFNLSSRDQEGNLRTTLSPGLAALIEAAFVKGQIAYHPSVAYDSSTGDTSLFHSLLGEITWEATPRLRLTASDEFTRSDEPRRADRLGLRRERQGFTSNTFAISSDYMLGTISTQQFYHLSTFSEDRGSATTSHVIGASTSKSFYAIHTGSLGYEYLTSATSGADVAPRSFDITGHKAIASVTRQLNPLTNAGVSGSYAVRTQTARGVPDTDFTIWGVSLFGTYARSDRLSLLASIGISRLESDPGKDRLLIPAEFSVSYRFARAIANLSIDQGFSETFAEGENFGVVETRGVRAALSYPFTPFLSGNAGGSYRRNKFTGVGGAPAAETEEIWDGSLSVTLRLRRWLTMLLEYAHTTSSFDSSGIVSENRVRLSLDATF